MQFIRNGPDVPERLIQAHEDGRVALFCGAGISYSAGLPSFERLVKKIYARLNHTPDTVQQAAIKAKQFDMAIGLLENQIVGGRETVRKALADILTPDFSVPNATTTHEALLTLSLNRDGRTRLVTTNFDRLFEEVIINKNLNLSRYQAPLLPVPKNRWDGLVYLHGLLPDELVHTDLDHLVVSSGDFGLAYQIERWAVRFVEELFQNYTVCFVGYSIDDPVLRYMTDALAADQMRGEDCLEMFAFGSYPKSKKDERTSEWRAKNVTPILYRENRRHWYLHETLREWAGTYRDGVRGKESIVVRLAGLRPLTSTKQDDFVGRVLWALSDLSGGPARRFADLDPVPSLDWLEAFSENRYRQDDLLRFGVSPHDSVDDNLIFSLTHRPSPYSRAPWMALVDEGGFSREWDDVMFNLARWLIRHLDDPALVLWLTKRGGQINHEFAKLIERRLAETDGLEQDNETDELNRNRDNAPRATPRPVMRTLWRLLLAGRIKSLQSGSEIYPWLERFGRHGLTTILRLELREMLTPRVTLREPLGWDQDQEDSDQSEQLQNLVDWEIVLSTDNVRSALGDLRKNLRWSEGLPDLLDDLGALLRDAMDLARELGGAYEREDQSFFHQPSITEHPQNMSFQDWTVLIELNRDAWLATVHIAPERARRAARIWSDLPYPVFRRLAFFAATQDSVIPPRLGLNWLLADDGWWLWSTGTQRETLRLLIALSPKLDAEPLAELEQAVLIGPPRAMFNNDIEPERWHRFVERDIWLRLAKMDRSGAALGTNARTKLDELSSLYPGWRFEVGEREEFPIWTSDGDEISRFVATPRRRRELVTWLEQYPGGDVWQDDDWRQRCRDSFPTTACALFALAETNTWPDVRWREALQAWSEEDLTNRSWRCVAPVLAKAPEDVMRSLSYGIGQWLSKVAKTFDHHKELFLNLCQRMLTLNERDDANDDSDDLVTRAINHPVGRVTEALLNLWTRSPLEDEQGLPEEISSIFTKLCDVEIGSFRHGRVLLAARVIILFRVDRRWAERHLLPLFEWENCEAEARAAWKGFLWSPRLHRPLMEKIKKPFLDTASHYGDLGRHGTQYANLLMYVALGHGVTFSRQELKAATAALPEDSLQYTANALWRALDSAGEQRVEYWSNRVRPYLRSVWPKSLDRKTQGISGSLGIVCVAAQDAFPDALKELRHWLQPPNSSGYLMRRLNDSDLCSKFPEHALDFLYLVTSDTPPWGQDLGECLNQIRLARPQLEDHQQLRKLRDL